MRNGNHSWPKRWISTENRKRLNPFSGEEAGAAFVNLPTGAYSARSLSRRKGVDIPPNLYNNVLFMAILIPLAARRRKVAARRERNRIGSRQQ